MVSWVTAAMELFYTASEFGEFPLVKTQWVPLKKRRFNA